MRLPFASLSLIILSVALAGANALGQTTGKSIKLCRGIPIPEGYTIVAEAASPDCPKGAYLIKKQEAVSANVVGRTSASQTPRPSDASRPRRVGHVTPQQPPEPDQITEKRPPTLIGSTGAATPAQQILAPAAPLDTGPEEVDEGDVVRINTTLVNVPVSVMDRQGRYVPNLRREDFRIFENGVEQEIASFDPTEKPFTVALLIDTSGSTRFRLPEIQEAAVAFANQLRPQDRVLIVTFSDEVLLLTEATNDRSVIQDVITFNVRSGSSTRLYDAVDLVIRERLNKIQGRKAIVLFTDGVDTSSYLATYESTLRQAEELDALIYPIQYDTYEDVRAQTAGSITIISSSSWPFPIGSRSSSVVLNVPTNNGISAAPGTTRADYDRANLFLNEIANKTAGRLYKADDLPQLKQAFSMIAEELRRQYSIGYYPKISTLAPGERRQIKVQTQQPGLAVRARDSYINNAPAGDIR